MDKTTAQTFVVGKKVDDIEKDKEFTNSYSVRIASVDGKGQRMTKDMRNERCNIEVDKDGVCTKFLHWG